MRKTQQVEYSLDEKGYFSIENYNKSKPFSNFFPGIAGLWGIPMWAFYVNRGQCITSFGVESKDKAIMEFQPANKAYRSTSLMGFRTFIKVKTDNKTVYWEPFQENLKGSGFKKKQKMSMSAHDLTIEEVNEELGLSITVNYFTLPEEPYSALVRRVFIKNNNSKKCDVEIIDGLPLILPYGITDWLAKNMCRTVEAWVKVRNVENKAPFYQLNVEVADKPEVKHIKEGNFFLSFTSDKKGAKLLQPIVEASAVFGEAYDFLAPERFLKNDFEVPEIQQTSNRTPCAFGYYNTSLKGKGQQCITSLFGYVHDIEQLNKTIKSVVNDGFIEEKEQSYKDIISDIRNLALTKSSSREFDLYSEHTFLDNILRGGLPVSLKTSEGNVALNVYSRKHGDIERDYNYFFVAPTYFSQGNGNYRDVNQNRRNDVWFNTDVKDEHLSAFLNLVQADGYNPLVVKGTTFTVTDHKKVHNILKNHMDPQHVPIVEGFLSGNFMLGKLLTLIAYNGIKLKGGPKTFLGVIIEACHKQESADHGEGFWSDHWTYNLDLIESYLSLYPEALNRLLLGTNNFTFYHNNHYVLPRDKRYVLTGHGVRQYSSVKDASKEIDVCSTGHKLRTNNGKGDVYHTNLTVKLLCIIANKVSTLDPSGIGIEMEADKPNWYDALNGLPGLLGSSVSETFELKRYSLFLLDSLNRLKVKDDGLLSIFKELAMFIKGLRGLLTEENNTLLYWSWSNDLKEKYRETIRNGIDGETLNLNFGEIKEFLKLVIKRTERSERMATEDKQGFLATYFYHEVRDYDLLDRKEEDNKQYVRPRSFKRHPLPLFLEGNVHELKCELDINKRKAIYESVRNSNIYDKKLKMYKVNADISNETEEIGRTRIFPSGWLENGSIWLHMEYKLMLELIKGELYDEFYENFKNVMVPFLDPNVYGRSILENSSFLVSSSHEDSNLHGQGFVARLSGSTAEFMHIWLLMNAGKNPFYLDPQNDLVLELKPCLPGWLFTNEGSSVEYLDNKKCKQKAALPKNIYAFNFLGSTLVVYHNNKRKNTYGKDKVVAKKVEIKYYNKKNPVVINSSIIPSENAHDIREHKAIRIDVHLD